MAIGTTTPAVLTVTPRRRGRFLRNVVKYRDLLLMVPSLLWLTVNRYVPMIGAIRGQASPAPPVSRTM